MTESASLIISFAIVLTASAVQGAAAFGFALVAVPLFLPLMPATEAVTTSLILGCFLNLLMIRDEWRQIVWREILALIPIAAAGIIVGMLVLKSFDGPSFKAALGVIFLAASMMMLFWHKSEIKPHRGLSQLAGAASGLLMGSTSMGGPPLVLYLTCRRLPKRTMRGTLALFFILGNIIALASFLAAGMIGAGTAGRSLFFVLAVAPGYLIGRKLIYRLNNDGFRKLVLVTMAIMATADIGLNLAG